MGYHKNNIEIMQQFNQQWGTPCHIYELYLAFVLLLD
jgi:hypothetical protein